MKALLMSLAISIIKHYDSHVIFTHQEYCDLLENYIIVPEKEKQDFLDELKYNCIGAIFRIPFYVGDKISWDNSKKVKLVNFGLLKKEKK